MYLWNMLAKDVPGTQSKGRAASAAAIKTAQVACEPC
jgi:hypothetical protein